MQSISNYIEGALVEPASGAWLETTEPATGQVYAQVPDSGADDVDRAVSAAGRAFDAWSHAPAAERSRIMLRIADLIDRDAESLARAESIDTGKPISLARMVDIPRAAANIRFFATRILHDAQDAHMTDHRAINYTLRRPLGAVACISPWNLPLYLFTWKIAPALAMGNTVVGKPSEVTPMTAFLFAHLCIEAGLPAGVLNIVHGAGGSAGQALVEHEGVKAVSFTGGTATGARIAATVAPSFRKLSLELGGKNPNVIFADADYDAALDNAVRAAFTNQGEICLCGSRILVERSLHDQFVHDFVERTRAWMRIGDPLDRSTNFGAIVSKQHYDNIMNRLETARTEGGEVRLGGTAVAPDQLPERCRDGWFIAPTIITGLAQNCRTNCEEIFGPVVTVQPFDDEDEAIALANATDYGLSATIWTENVHRAHRVAERIEAGVVWVNCWLLRDLRTPFGGMKQSGVGREGGDEAMRFFTEPKNVCVAVKERE